ncbi:MAG: hypothetical protein HOQ24_06430, partial [Mycobacteriaceae bacterium]|nr:hypothetical protein [Mycobacteriaceae bacterium]
MRWNWSGELDKTLSTLFVFPDNTVLCNFAAVNMLDVLKAVLNSGGRWAEAVAYEAQRSSRYIPVLRDVLDADSWLGEPIEIADPAHVERVERVRRTVFGGGDDKPLQHLGEAQTCFLIAESGRFNGSSWVSDDRESLRYARFQGISARETIDLMGAAVLHGELTAEDAFDAMR